MTNPNHDSEHLERSLRVWLTEGRPSLPDRDAQINTVLDSLDDAPQTRARFLGRWFDRGRSVRRGTDAHGHAPRTQWRNRLMLSATGITAALAIVALSVSVIDTEPAPPNAGGATHVVAADGSGDYTSIQAAVDASVDGDTVSVQPGTYVEAIVIDKDITLTGDGPREGIVFTAPEDGPGADIGGRWFGTEPYAVQLLDTSATFSNATLKGLRSTVHATGGSPTISGLHFDAVGVPYRGGGSPGGNSILINGGSTATVKGNDISDGGPIGVFGLSEPLIEANTLVGGPHIWGGFGDGAIIRGNTVDGSLVRAVFVGDPASPTIEGNIFTNTGQDGLTIKEGSPVVLDNTISGATNAVSVTGPSEPTISGNSLVDNQIALSWGAEGGLVEQNTVTGGRAGIVIVRGSPIVRDNTVEGAESRGIVVAFGASPLLTGNRSCGNGENLHINEKNDTFVLDPSNEICEDGSTE